MKCVFSGGSPIENNLHLAGRSGIGAGMTLDLLPAGIHARIIAVDWPALVPEEAQRLRSLGLEEGARVSIAHRGVFGGKDPIAVAVGRMIVAVRRVHAAAMQVEDL